MKSEEYKNFAKFRNEVESIPSTMRRKYKVDEMPVRGKLITNLFLGFKVMAFNFRKLFKHTNSLVSHTLNNLKPAIC